MRPSDKPKYSPPSLRRFESGDDVLGHFAALGSPKGFATALEFVADGEAKLHASSSQPKKIVRKR